MFLDFPLESNTQCMRVDQLNAASSNQIDPKDVIYFHLFFFKLIISSSLTCSCRALKRFHFKIHFITNIFYHLTEARDLYSASACFNNLLAKLNHSRHNKAHFLETFGSKFECRILSTLYFFWFT